MAEQTYQRVCRVIGDLAGIDPAGIGPGQSLGYEQTPNFYWQPSTKHHQIGDPHPMRPLELDSLDLWSLIMSLEEEFDIEISDEDAHMPSLGHVGGLVAFVQGKLDARSLLSFTHEPKPEIVYPATLPVPSNWMKPLELATAFATSEIGGTPTHTSNTTQTGDTLEIRAPAVDNSGVIEVAPVEWPVPSGNSMWQKCAAALREAGLDPTEFLIPEWQWLAAREELPA